MTTSAAEALRVGRWSRLDARQLRQPAVLIFNPNAGHKLGVDTNSGGSAQVLVLIPARKRHDVARTLWVPRDPEGAARTIADGKVLAMVMGRVGDRFFLEAAGVGLDAGLLGYFERLAHGASALGVLRAGVRFLRQLGSPRIVIENEGRRLETSSTLP